MSTSTSHRFAREQLSGDRDTQEPPSAHPPLASDTSVLVHEPVRTTFLGAFVDRLGRRPLSVIRSGISLTLAVGLLLVWIGRDVHRELGHNEDQVVSLTSAGQRDAALRRISSDSYPPQRERRLDAMEEIVVAPGHPSLSEQRDLRRRVALVTTIAVGGIMVLLAIWLIVLTLVHRYIAEREQAIERERKLIREQVARREAEGANRAKSEFLGRMSHEMKTPLNAILGFAQFLELDTERAEHRVVVEHILKAGHHLISLIDEVLDIARIESGRMRLAIEPVPVRRVLQESLEMVRLQAAGHGITLRMQGAVNSDPIVQVDQRRLKQVLLNLFSNAIKFNRPGGAVMISCGPIGRERLRITVCDTGRGISAEKLKRLFTPFDRLDADEGPVEGTGLGLAISKELVEAMGGELGVDSVEGEGSRFWVDLALAPRPTIPEPAAGRKRVQITREAAVAA